MKKHHVYGVGNALVDVEVEVNEDFLRRHNIGKGLMTLVDEQRQKELLGAIESQQHSRSCGGSAANTMIALRQLGGRGFYSCKVAGDEMGDFYFEDLVSQGLETNLSGERPSGITGRCLVFVTPDADRTMNTHLGITATLSEQELDEKELKDSEFVYLEGYLVTSETGRAAAIKARELAQANKIKTALTFSDPGIVEHFRDGFMQMIGKKVDLIFCNEAEALSFTQEESLDRAMNKLKEVSSAFVVTRGPKGAVLFDGLRDIHVLSPVVKPVDTNGAGDLFAGAFLYGITHNHSFGDSGRLACHLASTLVTQFGPRLRAEQPPEIKKLVLD